MNEPNGPGLPAGGPKRSRGIQVALVAVLIVAAVGVAVLKQTAQPPPPRTTPGGGKHPTPTEPPLSQKFEQVTVGMTAEEAEKVMGPGERTANRDGTERVKWTHKLAGGSWTFYVTVKDGKVAGKGNELR
jgi:hypothetical protein